MLEVDLVKNSLLIDFATTWLNVSGSENQVAAARLEKQCYCSLPDAAKALRRPLRYTCTRYVILAMTYRLPLLNTEKHR